MSIDKNKVSKKYIQSVLIYFVFIMVGQITFSNLWMAEISKLDVLQVIVAPSCCFGIAAMFGYYKNYITTFLSGIITSTLGMVFYMAFQKLTYYKVSTLEGLFNMNMSVMGMTLILTLIFATVINTLLTHIRDNRNKISE